MQLLQNIIALVVFVCIAALLIYVGVYIFLAVLVVTLIAFVWYGVKFYFLRKRIEEAVREHQGMSMHEALRRQQYEENGPVIEGEFEEVDEDDKKK